MREFFSRRKLAKRVRPLQGAPVTGHLTPNSKDQPITPPPAHALPPDPIPLTTQSPPSTAHPVSGSSSPRPLPLLRQDSARHHGSAEKKDYWAMAAEKLLREDPTLKDLIAGVRQAAAAAGSDDFATQLLDATERSRQELESKRWKIHVGAKEITLRQQFDRLVKVVTVLKDVTSTAASLDPVHAGLPLAGFCVLMQMATNDSDQYAAMVGGVEEVVTIVARYQHVEEIYRHQGATSLKAEFEQQLVSLYGQIIRYQVAASAYYRRNTLERYVRAIPKLDDLSDVTTAVRQQDRACAKVTQLFDSADALERHQEVVSRLDQFQQLLSRSGGSFNGPVSPISLTTSEQSYVHLFDQRSSPNIIRYPVEGTCRWSTETDEYKAWTLSNEPSILWLTGHAGSGKTTLTNFLIEYLQQEVDGKSGQDGAVYYWFCTRNDQAFRDARSLLQNLIVQILRSKREIIKKINRKFQTDKHQIDHSFNLLWTIFQTALAHISCRHIYIIIDAIDECDYLRKELLERISHSLSAQTTVDGRPKVVKYLISCQSTAHKVSWLSGPHIKHLHLEIELHPELANDVKQYLKSRIKALVDDEVCSPESAVLIHKRLAKLAGSSFLWLQVILDKIEQSPMSRYAERDFEHFITDLPVTLSDAYTRYLPAVQGGGLASLKQFLSLMVVSARPITLFEIDAFTDLKGHPLGLPLEPEQVNGTKDHLKKVFGPLIMFSQMTAKFVHPSVTEFLLGLESTPQHPLFQTHRVTPEVAHGLCATACIRYLRDQRINKDLFAIQSPDQTSSKSSLEAASSPEHSQSGSFNADNGSGSFGGLDNLFGIADVGFLQSEEVVLERCCEDIQRSYPAFDYAALNWTYHYARCDRETADVLEADSVALLSLETEALSNWYRYHAQQARTDMPSARTDMPSTRNAMILAAFFNLPQVVRTLLQKGDPSVNEICLDDALYWASSNGSTDCVSLLLEASVPTHKPGSTKIPLVVATQGGFLDICNLLLCQPNIDPNCCDYSGQPPLTIAAKQNHTDILTTLLAHEQISCDKEDGGGRTALAEACRCSALESLEVLIKDGRLDINARDHRGRTPFHHACIAGDDRVLKRLLAEADVDIAAKDKFGRNAASLAAENGHLVVVKRLHRIRVDIGSKDRTGRNAISWAANQGKAANRNQGTESVLEFMARKYPHCVDEADEDGWSPLAWALDPPGYTEAVRVLVRSGHANINKCDHSGRSILSWAAGEGFVDIVKILLAAPGIQKNSQSPSGDCPLISAAARGRIVVVRLLLEDPEVNVVPRDERGRSPMDWAKLNNHREVMALLQSRQ